MFRSGHPYFTERAHGCLGCILEKLMDVLWLHVWPFGSSTEHNKLPYMQARPQRPVGGHHDFQIEPCQVMTPRRPPIVFILGKVFCPCHACEVVSGCGGAIARSINAALNLTFSLSGD